MKWIVRVLDQVPETVLGLMISRLVDLSNKAENRRLRQEYKQLYLGIKKEMDPKKELNKGQIQTDL